ncbi:MAG TPA: hypothetical protein VFA75_21340 [Nevskia sp.]|nr:hypothetical protein [Nevskia sp.]
MALYELAVLGAPSEAQLAALRSRFADAAQASQLQLGQDIRLTVQAAAFMPSERSASAAVFFGGGTGAMVNTAAVLQGQLICWSTPPP